MQVFTFGLLVEMNELFVSRTLADERPCNAWSELGEETKSIAHVSSASEKIFTGLHSIVVKMHLFAEVWTFLSGKWNEEQSLKSGTTVRTRLKTQEVPFNN